MTPYEDALGKSLADFFFSDSEDPLKVSNGWARWRRDFDWALSLYETDLLDGPRPITRIGTVKEIPVINMASYNYLGMANHPQVVEAAKEALDRYGAGACGSPILSGMTDLHLRLEKRLAKFLGQEDALLFTSGYSGALGVISGLVRLGDVAILDERIHRSITDGVKLSGAKTVFFEHNNARDLDRQLEKYAESRRIVAVEGLYSMDGDLGDLGAICAVAESHGVGVIVDEAHSMLTVGKGGRGAIEHFACNKNSTLQYGTFSKSFAGVGGFIAGSKQALGYLRYYAGSYAFSCALPPSVVAGILAVLDIVENDSTHIETLASNAAYFRAGLQDLGIDTGDSCSQVVPIIVGADRKRLYEYGHALREAGLFLAPVDYPSVPENSLRFRASVSSAHTEEDLSRALQIIQKIIIP
ncbi:aminotransferase class I/II-fold pyridoxal phosphate-dependent enzyme [Streptomyces sp. NPDC047072]|uniref:aminotransferase class I/II-fold pyridoxal phosphate-dependent enzyme n=1 Tax=Streptomyces sp. NPDC047072 TaxID=3154809 RepID=UPI0033D396C9